MAELTVKDRNVTGIQGFSPVGDLDPAMKSLMALYEQYYSDVGAQFVGRLKERCATGDAALTAANLLRDEALWPVRWYDQNPSATPTDAALELMVYAFHASHLDSSFGATWTASYEDMAATKARLLEDWSAQIVSAFDRNHATFGQPFVREVISRVDDRESRALLSALLASRLPFDSW